MALPKQTVPQPLMGGIDTKTDHKLVRYPNMLQMDNAYVAGMGDVRKRFGYETAGTALGEGQALLAHKNTLLGADGDTLYRYANGAWNSVGDSSAIKVTAQAVTGGTTASYISSARDANHRLIAWWDGTYVRYSVQRLTESTYVSDSSLDAFIQVAQALTSYTGGAPRKLRVFAADNNFLICISSNNGLDHTVFVVSDVTLGPASLSSSSFFNVYLTGASALCEWEVVPSADVGLTSTTTTVVVLATRVEDNTTLEFAAWSSAGALLGAANTFNMTELDLTDVAVFGLSSGEDLGAHQMQADPSNTVLRLVFDSGSQNMHYLVPDLTNGSNVPHAAGSLGVDGSSGVVTKFPSSNTSWVDLEIAYSDTFITAVNTTTYSAASTIDATTVKRISASVYGYPYWKGGTAVLPTWHSGDYQQTLLLLDVPNNKVVAKALYSTLGTAEQLPREENYSDTTWIYAVPYKARVDTTTVYASAINVYYENAVCLLTFDTAHQHRYQFAELGPNILIGGGFAQAFDGQSVFEHGFHVFPEASAADTGAGALGAGNYSYKVIYEWLDAQGNAHRSAPSIAATVTTGASRQNTVTYSNYTLGNREASQVRIGIYRTTAGGTTVYYRVTTVSGSPTNSAASATSTYVDNTPDSTLTSRDTLYTSGGELDNDGAPPCQLVLSAKNRLWAVDEWGELWYSKEHRIGEASGFSLFLKKSVPTKGGAITALGYLDDKILIFKKDAIFGFVGEGPTAAGTDDRFSEVTELPGKLGCSNPLTIVEVEEGLIFLSSKGFYLIDRGMNVRFIGAGPHTYRDLDFTAAIHVRSKEQVRFYSSDGVTVVYNYAVRDQQGLGLWSTFSNTEAYDAVQAGDTVFLLRPNGELWFEGDGYQDPDGTWVTTTLETGWFAGSGPQGWKRVYRVHLLGDKKSEHTLNVGFAYNYLREDQDIAEFDTTAITDDSYGDGVFGAGAFGGGNDEGDIYQFRVGPARQECTAIKLRIWDTAHAGTGESFSLSDISFEVGAKQGPTRLSSGRSG